MNVAQCILVIVPYGLVFMFHLPYLFDIGVTSHHRASKETQSLYLLSATADPQRGIGLFLNLFYCRRAIHNGMDNVSLQNPVTGT